MHSKYADNANRCVCVCVWNWIESIAGTSTSELLIEKDDENKLNAFFEKPR